MSSSLPGLLAWLSWQGRSPWRCHHLDYTTTKLETAVSSSFSFYLYFTPIAIMSAMGAFRRVARVVTVGKAPAVSETDIEDELNLYKRVLRRQLERFNAPSATTEDKERALVHIGHTSYTADLECRDLIGSSVHLVIKIIGDKEEPRNLQIQGVRTLSEMCHYHRFIIDKVWKSVRFKQIIPGIVGDLENPLLSRWGCYLLSIMVAHSVAFLRQFEGIPGLVVALQKTAAYEHDWRGFGNNIAVHVLLLSGQSVVAKLPQEESEKKDPELTPTASAAENESITDTKAGNNAPNKKNKWMGRFNKVSPTEEKDSSTIKGKQSVMEEDAKNDDIKNSDSGKE